MVQFGIASQPDETTKWNVDIPDDPVKQSNLEGYLTFATAGANTRTTQIFINLSDNQSLDGQGFSAFGRVTGGYIDVARNIMNPTPNDSGGVDQTQLEHKGTPWALKIHPKIDMILTTTVTTPDDDADKEENPTANEEPEIEPARNGKPTVLSVVDISEPGRTQIALLTAFILIEAVFGWLLWCRR